MAKKEKKFKPKARKPRGFEDRFGEDIIAEQAMLSRIQEVYASYGFDPLETPMFEFTDALGKFLPDVDRPNNGVFSLQDDDEQWMSLRYDLTAPLARYVAENYDSLAKPFRRYAVGTVYRNEKPGPGRFRQFTQCDADTVGAPAPHADAEICAMFTDAIEAAGVARGDFVIRLSNRKIMSGMLEVAGLNDDANQETRLNVLRAMDKYDRLGAEGVRALLGEGRKDESGAYTVGAKISDISADLVMAFLAATKDNNANTVKAIGEILGGSEIGNDGVGELNQMAETLSRLGYENDRILIDSSIVRGLEYYTGPVFEADLTFDVQNDKGQVVQFGSVGGGGRYDDLVKRFKGIEVPAVGCSVGVSRLLSALKARDSKLTADRELVVILAMEKDQMASYQVMAQQLRNAGIRAEVYVGGSSMKAQLKYADKRDAAISIIQGSDERADNEVTIKDLILGEKLSKDITDNKAWREDQPAQFRANTDQLVQAVREVLAREY